MSFDTPKGDTSPSDMAEKCLWIGYDLYGLWGGAGVQDGTEAHGRDAVSRPGSTVAQQYSDFTQGRGWVPTGNVWKPIGSSLMNSQAIEYYQVPRSHKSRPKKLPRKSSQPRIASDGTQ